MVSFESIYDEFLDNLNYEKSHPTMSFIEKMQLWNTTANELHDIEFTKEDINSIRLVNGSMAYSVFKESSLSNNSFLNMNFSGAKFFDSTLCSCVFKECNVSNVVFDNTKIEDVTFVNCLGVSSLNFTNLTNDSKQVGSYDSARSSSKARVKQLRRKKQRRQKRQSTLRSQVRRAFITHGHLNVMSVGEQKPQYKVAIGKIGERATESVVLVEIYKPFQTTSDHKNMFGKVQVEVKDTLSSCDVNDIVRLTDSDFRKKGKGLNRWRIIDVFAKRENL